ncbi:hypothetical protein HPB52_003268 [Rhipicephalus sanguineus]|uniref:Cytochrome P450 n=1 Tax=Rhipicephalus sanguineus TaxID=34632 RepID=A0A9D4Q6X7_RHISA|nr:hypothetical protein HPB52_003268 [Rhipicephalus sanguineus]
MKAAYIPFGAGPRNCVGTRLGLLQLRYSVARIVQKLRLTLGPSQKEEKKAAAEFAAAGGGARINNLNTKLTACATNGAPAVDRGRQRLARVVTDEKPEEEMKNLR